jgi:peptidoglycan hydrolase CwlO-like protein
VKSEKGSLQS